MLYFANYCLAELNMDKAANMKLRYLTQHIVVLNEPQTTWGMEDMITHLYTGGSGYSHQCRHLAGSQRC